MTLFNKKILKHLNILMFKKKNYDIYLCESKQADYLDVHILTKNFIIDELNTLHCQEPRTFINEIDDVYLTIKVIEFALWDKFHGYQNKLHSFEVSHSAEKL